MRASVDSAVHVGRVAAAQGARLGLRAGSGSRCGRCVVGRRRFPRGVISRETYQPRKDAGRRHVFLGGIMVFAAVHCCVDAGLCALLICVGVG